MPSCPSIAQREEEQRAVCRRVSSEESGEHVLCCSPSRADRRAAALEVTPTAGTWRGAEGLSGGRALRFEDPLCHLHPKGLAAGEESSVSCLRALGLHKHFAYNALHRSSGVDGRREAPKPTHHPTLPSPEVFFIFKVSLGKQHLHSKLVLISRLSFSAWHRCYSFDVVVQCTRHIKRHITACKNTTDTS